ncbi:MAG: hypothetical protein WCR47_01980, partial [Desulfoplanes sp.]
GAPLRPPDGMAKRLVSYARPVLGKGTRKECPYMHDDVPYGVFKKQCALNSYRKISIAAQTVTCCHPCAGQGKDSPPFQAWCTNLYRART